MVRSCNCRCACSCSACSFASRFSSFSLSERLAASNCALRSSSSLAFASAALRRSRKLAASERSFFASAKDIVSCPSPAWGSGGVVSPAWGGGALPLDPAWGSAAVGSSGISIPHGLLLRQGVVRMCDMRRDRLLNLCTFAICHLSQHAPQLRLKVRLVNHPCDAVQEITRILANDEATRHNFHKIALVLSVLDEQFDIH